MHSFIDIPNFSSREKKTSSGISAKWSWSTFGLLSESAQRHLVSNVRGYLLKQELDANHLETHFPELTQSELEIFRLIIEGKKLRDICTILDKSETNISSQRAHIRKKLGMQPIDTLVEVLKARIGTEL